jgi:hypothetical protein
MAVVAKSSADPASKAADIAVTRVRARAARADVLALVTQAGTAKVEIAQAETAGKQIAAAARAARYPIATQRTRQLPLS